MTIAQLAQVPRLMLLVSLWSIRRGIPWFFRGKCRRREVSQVRLETGRAQLVALHI